MDLMANPKFKQFIGQFNVLSENAQKISLDEARKQGTDFFCPPTLVKENVKQIKNMKIQGRDGNEIPIRFYIPNDEKNLPVIVYYHRGGWVFCNVEEADPVCRKLANHLGCIIASVEYRLAPEHPFPEPLNDCYDALCWIANQYKEHKIIVAGESAGGNLAACVALMARDNKLSAIAGQLLIYPAISSTLNEEAYENCADQYFLTYKAMEFFWGMYLQNSKDAENSYASPDKASDLRGLPPAIIITAEHDPLHVEAEAYAEQLKKAGVPVTVDRFEGVIHGFLDLPIYPDDEIVNWIKRIGKSLKTTHLI